MNMPKLTKSSQDLSTTHIDKLQVTKESWEWGKWSSLGKSTPIDYSVTNGEL